MEDFEDVTNSTTEVQPPKKCKSCSNRKNNIFIITLSSLILVSSIYGATKFVQFVYNLLTH